MITCPNCNHQNPEGALQCEACYTPLPAMVMCPSCNTPVQEDASFCGQCGADLREATEETTGEASAPTNGAEVGNSPATANGGTTINSRGTENEAAVSIPDLVTTDPTLEPEPISTAAAGIPDLATTDPRLEAEPIGSEGLLDTEASAPPESPESPANATQLQVIRARLRHAQTDTPIEIPRQLSVVRIGKPNDQTPPDIDVSGFSDSEVVSRVHANLRVEGDVYYIEDVGSSNGTYVNSLPLAAGNRHRLRPGDRIALGKGDKVSFIFESA